MIPRFPKLIGKFGGPKPPKLANLPTEAKPLPTSFVFAWPRKFSKYGVRGCLVGPPPTWSYTGPMYDESGVSIGANPPFHAGKGVYGGPAVTNLFTTEPSLAANLEQTFQLIFPGSQTVTGVFQTKSASDPVYVDWGDGQITSYAGTSDQAFSHTYTSAGNYDAKFFASNQSVLTKVRIYGNTGVSGNLVFNVGMTSFNCGGSNTLSGALSLPSSMTNFTCYGSNTLSGALSLPSGMTSFNCGGSNTLSGAPSLPSSIDYFGCYGSNTLSNITLTTIPASQQRFVLTGYNTLPSATVDALINLYSTKSWTGTEKDFIIQGNAQNRTSASDAGYALLQAAGLRTLSVD